MGWRRGTGNRGGRALRSIRSGRRTRTWLHARRRHHVGVRRAHAAVADGSPADVTGAFTGTCAWRQSGRRARTGRRAAGTIPVPWPSTDPAAAGQRDRPSPHRSAVFPLPLFALPMLGQRQRDERRRRDCERPPPGAPPLAVLRAGSIVPSAAASRRSSSISRSSALASGSPDHRLPHRGAFLLVERAEQIPLVARPSLVHGCRSPTFLRSRSRSVTPRRALGPPGRSRNPHSVVSVQA